MRTSRFASVPQSTGRPDDRRTRERLRELCDEVLWSHRIATNTDLISEQERKEARALLSRFVPGAR